MLLVRLAHAAELPSPADLVRQIQSGGAGAGGAGAGAAGAGGTGKAGGTAAASVSRSESGGGGRMEAVAGGAVLAPAPRQAAAPQPQRASANPAPESYVEVVKLFADRREARLYAQLVGDVHLVRFDAAQGRIELRVTDKAQPDLIGQVGKLISEWTGRRWVVSVSGEEGEPTLDAQRQAAENSRFAAAAEHPLVKAALEIFPGARIEDVRELLPQAPAAADADDSEGDVER